MAHFLEEVMGKFYSRNAAQPLHEPPFSLLLGASLFLTISGLFFVSSFAFFFDKRIGLLPAVVICAVLLSVLIGGVTRDITKPKIFLAIALSPILIWLCAHVAAIFYDKSFDGIWYHRAAILDISRGWNPVLDYSEGGKEHSVWIDHYPRLSWIIGAMLFDATDKIEASKALMLVLALSVLLISYSMLKDLGCSASLSLIVALLLVFNPIVINQVFTGYVDGILYLLLVIAIAAFPLMGRFSSLAVVILFCAVALVVNVKFTALPYSLLVLASGASLLIAIKSFRAAKLALLAGSVGFFFGVAVLGFRPYLVNFFSHGHIFYPVMGEGAIDIMVMSTPDAFRGKGYFWKLGASLFGNVDWDEFRGFMVPFFGLTLSDFVMSVGHDVRVSGFGFLFGGAILISGLLFAFLVFVTRGRQRLCLIGVAVAILLSVFINPEAWWARYVPQLWLLPILIGGVAVFHRSRFSFFSGWLVLSVLAVNALVIAGGVFFSNIKHVRKVEMQLSEMASVGRPVFLYPYFFLSLERRLQENGIQVYPVSESNLLPCAQPLVLAGSFERAKYCQ